MAQLDEIPGICIIGAQEIIADIGTQMSRFLTAGHLVSWAKFAPKAPDEDEDADRCSIMSGSSCCAHCSGWPWAKRRPAGPKAPTKSNSSHEPEATHHVLDPAHRMATA